MHFSLVDGCQLLHADVENVTIFSYFVCVSRRMTSHRDEWSSSTGTRKMCSPSKHSWTLTRYKKIICCSYTVFQVLEQAFEHQLCRLSVCLSDRWLVRCLRATDLALRRMVSLLQKQPPQSPSTMKNCTLQLVFRAAFCFYTVCLKSQYHCQ